MKAFNKLADSLTPLAKGMNSEFCNQNAYDALQIHGGSGFMMDYPIQRIARDARITSIYEGTTQLQVVAAIRFVMNGSYSAQLQEWESKEVSEEMRPLQAVAQRLSSLFNEAVARVKEVGEQEFQDLCARNLVEMAANALMLHLLLYNASQSPELFAKSARVFARFAESEAAKHHLFVMSLTAEEVETYRHN